MSLILQIVDHTEEELEQQIQANLKSTADLTDTKVGHVSYEIDRQEEAINKMSDALEKRVAINGKHETRYRALEKQLTELQEKWNSSHAKGEDLRNKLNGERSVLRALTGQKKLSCKDLAEVEDKLNRNIHTHIARSLKAVVSLVDTNHPIRWSGTSFHWRTRVVKIRDKDGVPLPLSFGQYDIAIHLENGNLKARMGNNGGVMFDGYSHPHVTSDGTPCLGNVANVLLRDIESGDITHAIVMVDKFLSSYNPADPYVCLDKFIPCKWHTAMCECGLNIITDCGCDRCGYCHSLVSEEEILNPSSNLVFSRKKSGTGCGNCGTCCSAAHVQTRTDGKGINNSNCLRT